MSQNRTHSFIPPHVDERDYARYVIKELSHFNRALRHMIRYRRIRQIGRNRVASRVERIPLFASVPFMSAMPLIQSAGILYEMVLSIGIACIIVVLGEWIIRRDHRRETLNSRVHFSSSSPKRSSKSSPKRSSKNAPHLQAIRDIAKSIVPTSSKISRNDFIQTMTYTIENNEALILKFIKTGKISPKDRTTIAKPLLDMVYPHMKLNTFAKRSLQMIY